MCIELVHEGLTCWLAQLLIHCIGLVHGCDRTCRRWCPRRGFMARHVPSEDFVSRRNPPPPGGTHRRAFFSE